MKKKVIILISLFIIGISIGLGIGMYSDKTLESFVNYDYVCGIEKTEWSECSDGEWTEPNMGNKEKVSIDGDIIPPQSRMYKGTQKKISKLKYGNNKNGCNQKLLFSSVSNGILQLRDSKDFVRQEIDIFNRGVIILENDEHVEFIPEEIRFCKKIEPIEVNDKKRIR